MDQELENFHLSISDENDISVETFLQGINLIETRLNIARSNSDSRLESNNTQNFHEAIKTYDEVGSFTEAQENISELKVAVAAVKNLFTDTNPEQRSERRKYYSLLSEFRKKDTHLSSLSDESITIQKEIAEMKMRIKEERDKLLNNIKKEREQNASEANDEKYERRVSQIKKKIKNTELLRCLTREIIINCDVKYEQRPDVVNKLKKLHAPVKFDL